MEATLDTYEKPYDASNPVVCVDEASKQLVKETREPIAAEPGQPLRFDYEYERNGTANLFMAVEPLSGIRNVVVTEHRTSNDFAHFLKKIADEFYPEALRITLVLDNLNTHKLSVLYEAFDPEEAHRLANRFNFVYTPKHGSWLNIAEVEFAVLRGECLGDRRIGSMEQMKIEVAAWQQNRNNRQMPIEWQFTTPDARIKLRKLYPKT